MLTAYHGRIAIAVLLCFGSIDNVTAFQIASPRRYCDDDKLMARPSLLAAGRHTRRVRSSLASLVIRPSTGSMVLQATPVAALAAASISPMALWYMCLLAVQFGSQPILTRKFTPKAITRSTVIMMQDIVKVVLGLTLMVVSCGTPAVWSVREWLYVSSVPASLYVVQNYCSLMAYQNLPAVTYNVLNQTKTLSAALCCYLFLGAVQSKLQIISLFVLGLAAMVLEGILPLPFVDKKEAAVPSTETETADHGNTRFTMGVLPLLLSSFISGLAGAFCQRTLQTHARNAYLFTSELSAASTLVLLTSLVVGNTPDSKRIREDGFWNGWTWQTWIPVVTQASGGILVGLVVKHAGTVRKGFGLIFGLVLSGVLQAKLSKEDGGVTPQQMVGGVLAALSLYMHSTFPVPAL
jgi:solute carrier family 35 (UDP-sugar transporter), member A1/2/3